MKCPKCKREVLSILVTEFHSFDAVGGKVGKEVCMISKSSTAVSCNACQEVVESTLSDNDTAYLLSELKKGRVPWNLLGFEDDEDKE